MKSKFKFAYITLFISTFFVILGFVSPSAKQCPEDYTQAQIDAEKCTVGAYIGIPPKYDFIIAGVVLSAGVIVTRLKNPKK